MPSSVDRPCDVCAQIARCRSAQLACRAFVTWVDEGRVAARATLQPSAQLFLDLARFDNGQQRYRAQRERDAAERRATELEAMRQAARREAFEHRRQVAAGLAQPRSKAERRKLQLARRRLRWRIDPSLRKRHLALKRADAIRRGRLRGSAPKGSAGNRLHRREGQLRRRRAEREAAGRTMTGTQFREARAQLELTLAEIACQFGATYSAAKGWQRNGPPARVEAWLLERLRAREEMPAVPGGAFRSGHRRRPRLCSAAALTAYPPQATR